MNIFSQKATFFYSCIVVIFLIAADSVVAQSYQIAYGTINSDGTGDKGTGYFSWRQDKGRIDLQYPYLADGKTPAFNNPAATVFSVLGTANYAVRFGYKNDDTNRRLYGRSNVYDNRTKSGDKPKLENSSIGFITLSRSDISPSQPTGSSKLTSNTPKGGIPTTISSLAAGDKIYVTAASVSGNKMVANHGMNGDKFSHSGTGEYKFEFATKYADSPAAIASINAQASDQSNEAILTIYIKSYDSSWVTVGIVDGSGNAADGNFTVMTFGTMSGGSTATNKLSSGNIAYGAFPADTDSGKTTNVTPYFGDGIGVATRTKPSQYAVPFSKSKFSATPFVIVGVEHEKDNNTRQPQVVATSTNATVQIVGRKKCCGNGSGNDARFDIIAFQPTN